MPISKYKYLMVYTTPLVVIFSLLAGGLCSYSAVILLFGIIPIIELFTVGSTANLSEGEEEIASKDRIYDYILYGLVPLQYFILVLFLILIGNEELTLVTKIGMTSAFGMSCGVIGINAAHELGHRSTRFEQTLSKILLMTTLYMHFFIEHNRGHHKTVATAKDPASSRYGESLYTFFFRTIYGSWVSAWNLESGRLKKSGSSFWSWKNEMLRMQLIQLALIISIYFIFGGMVLVFFVFGAFIGILMLETVNYIEHYGLGRQKKGESFERTMPAHSWNSNHPLGRLLLIELSRHSDHHYKASRKYQILRHFDESPQMPTGYPGMMVLALLSPLWFYVMHKRIDVFKKTESGRFLV